MANPNLTELVEALATDNGLERKPEPEWNEVEDVETLERLAGKLDEIEKETFAVGSNEEQAAILERLPELSSLFDFLEEAFQGEYYDLFFQD